MKVKIKFRCLQFAHWPRLPKDFAAMSLKYSHEQSGKELTLARHKNGCQLTYNQEGLRDRNF
jgi:hypothetical protein